MAASCWAAVRCFVSLFRTVGFCFVDSASSVADKGLSDREIASRLHRSPHTIKHYVERLREAVGARNRIELAAWAGRHGFDQPSSSSVADVLA